MEAIANSWRPPIREQCIADATGRKCGGKLHKRDGTCTLPAGWGTSHAGWGRCRKHGGNAPNVVKAAENLRLTAQASAALARLDVPPVDDPLAELSRLAGQAVAWKDACAALVNELRRDDLRYEAKLGTEQLRSEIALFERSMDRCAAFLTPIVKLGLDERRVRVEEIKVQMVASAVREALARSGATEAQQLEAKRHVILRLAPAAGEVPG